MKSRIPFYPSHPTPDNPYGIHCVENCLQMILGYFEPDNKYSLKDMEKITAKQPEKATWEMQWSIWFVNHGFEVIHYSTFDYEAFREKGIQYIRDTYGDDVAKWQSENSDIDEARKLVGEYLEKVDVTSRGPTISDIRKALNDGYMVKACVNQKMINNQNGYIGHSVVVTDIDDEKVWFHDPGLPAFENRNVSLKLFQEAMDSYGGEMDVVKKV